jgi:hypothetical protein
MRLQSKELVQSEWRICKQQGPATALKFLLALFGSLVSLLCFLQCSVSGLIIPTPIVTSRFIWLLKLQQPVKSTVAARTDRQRDNCGHQFGRRLGWKPVEEDENTWFYAPRWAWVRWHSGHLHG